MVVLRGSAVDWPIAFFCRMFCGLDFLRAPCLWPTGKHKHCWKQENAGDCDPEGEGLKEILEGLAVAEHHGEFNASRRKKLASVSGKLSIQPRPKEMALAAES